MSTLDLVYNRSHNIPKLENGAYVFWKSYNNIQKFQFWPTIPISKISLRVMESMTSSWCNGTSIINYQLSDKLHISCILCNIYLIYISISWLYLVILYFLYFLFNWSFEALIVHSCVYHKNPDFACACLNLYFHSFISINLSIGLIQRISCLPYDPMMVIPFV